MKRKKIDTLKLYSDKTVFLKDKKVDSVTDSSLCFLLSIKFCFYFFTGNYDNLYFENELQFAEYQKTLFSYRKKERWQGERKKGEKNPSISAKVD